MPITESKWQKVAEIGYKLRMATTQEKYVLQVIRERMKALDLNMKDLADQIGTSQSAVSRLLSGETELSIDRMYEISRVLGVSGSALVEEAERKMAPIEFPEAFEEFVCSDFRRYLILVALNGPRTVSELMGETKASQVFIQAFLKRLNSERMLMTLQADRFQLNDRARRSKFRSSKAFYELKAKLFSLQSEHTVRNLSQPPEYWKNRDDRLVVAYLTQEQAERFASMIEGLGNQIEELDRQNVRASGSRMQLYQFFLTQKMFADFRI